MDAYTTTLATAAVVGSAYWVFDTMRRRQVPPELGGIDGNIPTLTLLPKGSIYKRQQKETDL